MTTSRFRLAFLGVIALACGAERDAPSRAEIAKLPDGIAARVGNDDIPADLVKSVALAQGISPTEARERAVSDALFAEHARNTLRGTGLLESAERAALARAVLEELRREAEEVGPPTDLEVDEVTNQRWLDFARPVLLRTSHVVVLDDAAQKSDKTRRVAERIREAVKGIADAVAFEEKARSVDAEGLKLKVEHLPPVALDGRIGDPKQPPGAEVQRFETSYSQAAFAIAEVPGTSGLVETRYGLHVILALERLPEKIVPLEERRLAMTREIVDRRARQRHQQVLEAVNKATPVMLDRGANELLARVQVGK